MIMFLPQGAVRPNFEIWECYPVLILHTGRILASVFGWETERIWIRSLIEIVVASGN